MFFPAFHEGEDSRLPKETIFTVEYLTSQILSSAEPQFLEQSLKGHFIEAILQELEFFGQLRKSDFPAVKKYLMKQESSLQDIARDMIKEPDNVEYRRHLLAPNPLQTS
jgi:hypothetical protein